MKTLKPLLLILLSVLTMTAACKKDEVTPPKEDGKPEETLAKVSVSTIDISGITETSAVSGGNISVIGKATIKEAGICWGVEAKPTVFNDFKSNPSANGDYSDNGKAFEIELTDLEPETRYYVRAYVKYGDSVTYGNEISFETGVVDKDQYWSYFDSIWTTNLLLNYDKINKTLLLGDQNRSGNLGVILFHGGLEYPKTYTLVNVTDSLQPGQAIMTFVLDTQHWVGVGNNGTVIKTTLEAGQIRINLEGITLMSVTDSTKTTNTSALLVLPE